MGNITNLATTGNYATEANGIKVSFDFTIDNESKTLKTINAGQVTENGTYLASFNMYDNGGPMMEQRNRQVNYNLPKGREVELLTAIVDAIAALEEKIKNGEAVQTAL